MKIKVQRFLKTHADTTGLLLVDGVFECFTLEDEYRRNKVRGATRIPAGKYEVKLRAAGGMHPKYARRFANHEGMLHLQKVPDFKWIYIHIGNDHTNTDGCILVGRNVKTTKGMSSFLHNSTQAYKELYAKILKALHDGDAVTVEVCDECALSSEFSTGGGF